MSEKDWNDDGTRVTTPEETAEIKEAVSAGRIEFEEGWNKPLPVLTPRWVERAREMIEGYQGSTAEHLWHNNFEKAEIADHKIKPLEDLLKAEGYEVK